MSRKAHIVYILIIVGLVGSNTWWINHSYDHDHAAEHYIQHVKDTPLLDPALPFYDKKNLIVNIQSLREWLKTLTEQNKDWAEMSIYFEVLNTGANISVNPETKILPASLMKLPAGMVAMKKVEKGEWTMDTKITLLQEDADLETRPAVVQDIGKSFPLSFLLEEMLLKSDNTSFWMLVRQFTEEELRSLPEAVGLDREFSNDEKVSAKEYTRMLRALYSATYLNEENSQKLLGLLVNSETKNLLKAGTPENVLFAHKWGINDNDNVYSDSGIVYLEGRPYIISVMIAGKSSDHYSDRAKAEKLMKEIAEQAYSFMLRSNTL